jgi:hypothetical protein
VASILGLPSYIAYQQQARDEALRQQYAQMQFAQFAQQQQDRQRQQAALAAAGNALPQLIGQQQQPQPVPQMAPPPPQPPMPGQPSQPARMPQQPQAGAAAPLPGMGAAPGGVKPPLPPFRPMPTAGGGSAASQTMPSQIPAPPQPMSAPQPPNGQLSLENAIKVLQDQGLSGADLMAGLQTLQPVLDSQAKMQAAQLQTQFTNELKLAQLSQRKDEADQRAADRKESLEFRMQAHQDSLAIQGQMMEIRRASLNNRLQGDPNAALDPDDLKFMAEQYLAGDRTVLQNLGRGAQGSKNLVALRNEVRKQAQSQGMSGKDVAASVAEFEGVKAGERSLGTRTAQAGMAVNEADQFADIALQASQSVPRTQFVPANKALNAYQTNTGDPKIVAFGAATNSLINAYARAISPSGTPTVSDKEHARDMLNTAQTPEQFASVISMMKKEMAAAQKSPGQVRSEFRDAVTRGKPMANPPPPVGGGLPSGWSVTEH